jgi:ribosomal protein S18 acetylase RimI-like enzyme
VPEPEPYVVRPARREDAEAIAVVLTDALGDKFRPAFGRHAARAMTAVVRHDLERGALSYWVAERGGRTVGAVHLALAQEPDPGFTARVASAAGWGTAVRATIVLSLLSHARMAADEAYVEDLAVSADARRLGLGRALMLACEREAAERGKRRLTLWVTANNGPGIALYDSLGFTPTRRRRTWLWGRLLFGAPAAIFMEKPLGAAPA